MLYADRAAAGRAMAIELARYARRRDVVVLALPRGGVPVAYEVAVALDAPLDVFLVRKLGVPGREELAMGAIASGGVRVLNHEIVEAFGIPEEIIAQVTAEEHRELERREELFRDGRAMPELRGRTVILMDDGLATGATMRAAVRALRLHAPARVIVAVPIAAAETCEAIRREADEIVCALTPRPFVSVGIWYEDFSQTTDEEVCRLLRRAAQRQAAPAR
jgi:putative phosphoribosyl transferase